MDNLGSHKARLCRRAIRAAGARVLLLPNTHRLKPDRQFFAKFKQWLRKAARRNYQTAVYNAIGPI